MKRKKESGGLVVKPHSKAKRAGIELDKRTYLPFVCTSKCPECGRVVEKDLLDDYLSYPRLGRVAINFYCYDEEKNEECGEWTEHAVLGFTLEVAP